MRLVLATLAFLVVLLSPMLVLQVFYWLRIYFEVPNWLLELATACAFLMAFEVANRIGPDPSETPLSKFRKHYPTRRDKLVFLLAIVITRVIIAYRPSTMIETNWLILVAIGLLGCLVFFTICILFGTNVLRDDMTPKIVKRWLKR
jgi:hypothetical protein